MRVITPEAILSYPNLFEPRAITEGATPKYSASLVFPEDADLSELEKAAAKVLKEKFGKKADALLKKVVARRNGENTEGELKANGLRWPIRTDNDSKGYPEGSRFFGARSERAPQIVTAIPDENGRPSKLEDRSKVYPGVIVRASLDAYAYDVSGNRGVTFGLGNIQILRDGERLDSKVNAEAEFEADPDAVADLSDLTSEDPAAADGADEDEQEGDDLSALLG